MNAMNLYQGITAVSPRLVEEAEYMPNHFHVRRWARGAAAVAACAAVFAIGSYQLLFKTAATVYVTINPHVSMELNRLGGVTELTALNADGFTLLDGYDAQGKSRVDVTQELIFRAQTLGFLTEDGQVTISIEADSTALAEKYDTEFSQSLAAETIPVTVREMLPIREIKSVATEYLGLTLASFDEIKCDAEHEQAIYTVKLHSGASKYECRIDAVTGEVLKPEQATGGQMVAGSLLSQQEAQALALGYAEAENAVFTQVKLEEEDGASVYRLKFETDEANYECVLNASSGAILDFDVEYKAQAQPVPTDNGASTDSAANSSTAAGSLTAEQAKAIALDRAGITAATFSMVEQVTIHGTGAWKLKFYTDTGDYYCMLYAATGDIVEYEGNSKEIGHEHEEAFSNGKNTAVSTAAITEAQAKTIALNYAGVTTADFEKIELDTDDGRAVYKLEFTAGGREYECRIDAASGAILEWDAEKHH